MISIALSLGRQAGDRDRQRLARSVVKPKTMLYRSRIDFAAWRQAKGDDALTGLDGAIQSHE